MADYFALISRAVASLDQNTIETRKALYERARAVLVERLRASDPPWTEDRIAGELAALDSAIRQIESEITRSARPLRPTPVRAPSRIRPQPPVDMDSATDADQILPRQPGAFSPTLIGALGAVALALLAAGGYAYLSRPAAKVPAPAAIASKPATSGQGTDKKTAAAAAEKSADTSVAVLPYGMGRQFVFYRSSYPAGTIIISTSQHKLYRVKSETVAIQYSIGVGTTCVNVVGLHRVLAKQEWPSWPPAPPGSVMQVQAASANPGEHRAESRLGARALFLNDVDYGIHGTVKSSVIGQNSPFGCFLLIDDDVTDLYGRTPVDTRVIITN
jgi:lipoprotein-anchoring transpeptidase ErfK/SrfK